MAGTKKLLADLSLQIGADAAELRKGLNKANSHLNKFNKRTNQINKKLNDFKRVALAAFSTTAIISFGRQLVQTRAQFSKTISRVQALTGATEAMAKSFSNLAIEMGTKTQFTANQAAEAMTFLAQAGLNNRQIMDALPGTLELAAAGNIELAESADIATNVLAAYNMQASELGTVNDIIANVTSKANTNVLEFAEAFKMVGPIAKTAGIDIKETSAFIGLLGNAGLKATVAGTGLRAIISQLANVTPKAQAVLKKYGITVTNADGSLRDLNDILKDLKTAQLSTSELFTLFGNRAASAASVLIDSSDSFEGFVEVVGESGTAAEMAATQMDNLQGDIDRLSSAWEAAMLRMGGSSNGFFRGVIKGVTNVIDALGKLFSGQLRAIWTGAGFDFIDTSEVQQEIERINAEARAGVSEVVTPTTPTVTPTTPTVTPTGGGGGGTTPQINISTARASEFSVFQPIASGLNALVEKVQTDVPVVQERVNEFLNQTAETSFNWGETVGGVFTNVFQGMSNVISDAFSGTQDLLSGFANFFGTFIKGLIAKMIAATLAALALVAIISLIPGLGGAGGIAGAIGKAQGFGAKLGTAFSGIGFADGGVTPYSGTFLVGERGPELAQLPRGTRIFNNADTRSMMGGPQKIMVEGVIRGQDIYIANQRASNLRQNVG